MRVRPPGLDVRHDDRAAQPAVVLLDEGEIDRADAGDHPACRRCASRTARRSTPSPSSSRRASTRVPARVVPRDRCSSAGARARRRGSAAPSRECDRAAACGRSAGQAGARGAAASAPGPCGWRDTRRASGSRGAVDACRRALRRPRARGTCCPSAASGWSSRKTSAIVASPSKRRIAAPSPVTVPRYQKSKASKTTSSSGCQRPAARKRRRDRAGHGGGIHAAASMARGAAHSPAPIASASSASQGCHRSHMRRIMSIAPAAKTRLSPCAGCFASPSEARALLTRVVIGGRPSGSSGGLDRIEALARHRAGELELEALGAARQSLAGERRPRSGQGRRRRRARRGGCPAARS